MDEIKSKFGGTWKLHRSEKWDEFLKKTGANFVLRKMMSLSKPEQTIEVKDTAIDIKTKIGVWTIEEVMKVDEEYECEDQCVKQKAFCKYEDGKLVKTQSPIGASAIKEQKITREIADNDMLMTIECDGVVCKRWFKRVS
ncbi:fatty acid-binding protein, heart-like [Gigantopelta aegis]|uniref:fatty acid-binding protein, heart-like n=1 Tax=Gigantopelta aegis TaxID=1735272 RepID=UPI001B8877DE|nr:fatty acid-binding protein, heart-like [Gigantopelta aegis]